MSSKSYPPAGWEALGVPPAFDAPSPSCRGIWSQSARMWVGTICYRLRGETYHRRLLIFPCWVRRVPNDWPGRYHHTADVHPHRDPGYGAWLSSIRPSPRFRAYGRRLRNRVQLQSKVLGGLPVSRGPWSMDLMPCCLGVSRSRPAGACCAIPADTGKSREHRTRVRTAPRRRQ